MRFTIRDLLWLTVVVGLALGWGIDHWRQGWRILELEVTSRERERIVSGIQEVDSAGNPVWNHPPRFSAPDEAD